MHVSAQKCICVGLFDSEVKDYIYCAVRPKKIFFNTSTTMEVQVAAHDLGLPVNQMECMSTRGFIHIIMVNMCMMGLWST